MKVKDSQILTPDDTTAVGISFAIFQAARSSCCRPIKDFTSPTNRSKLGNINNKIRGVGFLQRLNEIYY